VVIDVPNFGRLHPSMSWPGDDSVLFLTSGSIEYTLSTGDENMGRVSDEGGLLRRENAILLFLKLYQMKDGAFDGGNAMYQGFGDWG